MATYVQNKIKELFCSKGLSLSAAESCTGGQISHLLTGVSGASEYYLGSVTSYAISVKESVLGVDSEVIRSCGVVSSEVAVQMAEGVRRLTGSSYAVSTTGLAGPGGDDANLEGTVWIGVAGPHSSRAVRKVFKGDRAQNIRHFADCALKELYGFVLEDIR